MLALPDKGIAVSVNEHNSKLDTCCDWIEGSILFSSEELSSTDIIDFLIEEGMYKEQDFASQMVDDAWAEMRRRQVLVGSEFPFSVEHRRIKRLRLWQDVPAHSFCTLLSLATVYDNWGARFGSDYTVQGELFELLTKESLEHQLPGWKIYHTGWCQQTSIKLPDIVDNVINQLGELPGNIEAWANPNANDAGLDLLCYQPFADNRVGIPVYLMQCASGGDWKQKLRTPELELWTKVIQFAAEPKKAFATPFAFLDDAFRKTCSRVNGMLLDRYRLLTAYRYDENWVSAPLSARIIAWAEPRVSELPRGDA